MIKGLSDHQANERTFLAWIRTAVALMAFGFLIEKFTIFVAYIRVSLHSKATGTSVGSADMIGASMVIVGVVVIVLSTFRFVWIRRKIDSDTQESLGRPYIELLLGLVLGIVGVLLVVYVGGQVD